MGKGDRGSGGGRSRSPNDDRSDSKNQNNPAYWASIENRADQLNPDNPEYKVQDKEDKDKEDKER